MKHYLLFLNEFRGLAGLYLAVSILAGLSEALGLVALVPALEAISTGSGDQLTSLYLPLSTLLAAISLRFLSEYIQARILSKSESNLRRELVSQIFFSPWSRVRLLTQGQITNGVVSESSQVANGIFAFLNALSSGVLVAILWAAAYFVNPAMALLTSTFLIAIAALLRLRLKKFKIVESQMRSGYQQVSEQVSSLLSEIKFIRLSPQKTFWLRELNAQASKLAEFRRRQIVLPATNRAILESMASVFLIVSLAVMAVQGAPITQGIVFLGIFYRLVPRLQSFQGYISTCVGQKVWLVEWQKRRAHLGESSIELAARDDSVATIPVTPISGARLEVSSVTLSDKGSILLNDLNLSVEPGTFLVISGRTGAGKTTLIDAMLGLRTVDSGQTRIDGNLLTSGNLEESLLRVAVVTQDVPIFAGTIGSNITCGFEMDDGWIREVSQVASLTSYINAKSQGYEFELTSKGLSLSGGERQRIGIARALYSKPQIIVLDEATNGLDERTEFEVVKAIRSMGWNMTIVAITHRASLIEMADRVVYLENGKLTEGGETPNGPK